MRIKILTQEEKDFFVRVYGQGHNSYGTFNKGRWVETTNWYLSSGGNTYYRPPQSLLDRGYWHEGGVAESWLTGGEEPTRSFARACGYTGFNIHKAVITPAKLPEDIYAS